MNPLLSESVALFGSICRNSVDNLSDRDILLIDDSSAIRRHDARILSANGWSVAKYSWRRLDKLRQRQALFVQHLKLECRIIQDRNQKLAALIESFKPAPQYWDDIQQAEKIISLVERVPNSPQGIGWACDVLAVGVRILGIGLLANEGRYEFGFNNILRALSEIDQISDEDQYYLRHLRRAKSAYRRRTWREIATASEVLAVLKILRKFRIDINCEIKPAAYFRGTEIWPKEPNGYPGLRSIERAYWSLSKTRPKDEPEFLNLKSQIRRALLNPQDYLARARTPNSRFEAVVRRLDNICI